MREVISSLTFRYIAKYLLVLSATVFLVMAGLYLLFSYNYFRQLSASIVEEQQTLELVYRGQGLAGVSQYINDQRETQLLDRFHYLVSDQAGNKVAGDLPEGTSYQEFERGWLGFELALLKWGESVEVDFIARGQDLGGGYRAIIARSFEQAVYQGRLVLATLVRTMVVTILLGLIGGYFAAARSLQRVEWLGREMGRIFRGNPSQRLDAEREKGQVRELAQIMNKMLDQTESLMHGVRSVSDNIAHDLRTPLSRMRNQLSQLHQDLPAGGREDVQQLIADCDSLLTSFNAVLRISTLESGSRYAGATEVDLRQLLEDVVELYEPVAQECGVELQLASLPAASCRGEADLLFQMFANVLDNAIKYTPDGGAVRVELVPTTVDGAPGHRVTIADTGPGISAEHWEDVFRRFYRVEPSRSSQPGHGLGLSMAQAIAHYHGGKVDLQDNNPGLRVLITLP
ncbi:HAMP domain-containing histidine kinase [Seongchinamella unica]|uniref:histidine kinase n=1 Tax=Seongchinamella unica TaxID=2547392 RepID=A0A4R5LNX1_9GAMM|nr:HAMP domain-containing sensor histidine kinase [Seongchinamella unica]TDG12063.1 HAMP domain-containing histidine kinase [Seongchinamella unica]